jgi:ParB family chromosome partitioning protein
METTSIRTEEAVVFEPEVTPISNVPEAASITDMSRVELPSNVKHISTDDLHIDAELDPRRYLVDSATVQAMGKDIAENGQIEPILVRKLEDGKYSIINGRTRTRAVIWANENKLTDEPMTVAAVVLKMDDLQALVTAAKTFNRTDLSPIDWGTLINKLVAEGHRKKDISLALGKTKGQITEWSQMASLRPAIQQKIHKGIVPWNVAQGLSGMSEEEQDEVVSAQIEGGRDKARLVKRNIKQRKADKSGGEAAKVSLSLKELKAAFNVLAGVGLEEGKDYPYSEGMQKLGKLLIKLAEGRMGEKALVNQLRGVEL